MMGLAALIATPLAWFVGKMLLQNIYNRIALKPGFFITGILFLLTIGILTSALADRQDLKIKYANLRQAGIPLLTG